LPSLLGGDAIQYYSCFVSYSSNDEEFARFKVEGPYPIDMLNIPYMEFIEHEEQSVAQVPRGKKLRIVCAKEGSAKFVAEIMEKHGFDNVGYLAGGIKSWGNLLVPKLLNTTGDYQLYQFIRPGKGSCSYGLAYNGEIIFFDPSRNDEFYIEFAKDKGCKVIATVETHLQADYIAGSRVIAEKTGAVFYANENDFTGAKIDYNSLVDGQEIGFRDGPSVKVQFSPGHTPGSTMYLIDGKFIITGDIIFIKSIGRPDLGGKVEEWSSTLYETIRTVASMDGNLTVLPAHFIGWDVLEKGSYDIVLKKYIYHA
jgi:glyoxylase-like metal-dependent hydrolase (beta-lactamase superfamily II)